MGVFTDGGLYQYASYAMAWLFPYMIFICLCGFLSGVLHSFQKFTIPALLPIVLNTFFIATSLYIGSSITDEKLQLKILCIAIVISGIVQLVILVPGLYKLGWRFKPLIYKATTESRKLLKNFIPGLFSAGLYQINLVCDRLFAAWLGAYAVSSLYYSERLVYLPVGLFAVSIATVCLPLMSKAFAENKIGDVTESIFFSIKILNILCLPCVAVLCISGKEIISILFERGAFTADSLNDCYGALLFYSFGIPAYAIIKILRSAFFSQQDVKTPLKVSGVCFVLNIVLNLCLIGSMEQKGLALATAISSTVNCLILFYILFKRFEGQSAQFKSLAITTGKQLLAVGIFIVFLLIMKDLSLNPIPSLIISLTTASLIYFLSLIFLSKKETFAVVATVKKKLGF
ncbi:MAG: murein biosynthesis integral membrane protein MurJ, partial [Lentisphaeria bacterium]|nr:murein biosynthesis integral membrane protein MurJ [Lentisphaeria bacterium]NQZ67469.1 murein biosynthesis integral membrane protein MurJ [Lentisphaeria bacterium]